MAFASSSPAPATKRQMKTYLGVDCGSVSVKFALLADGELMGKVYLKNRGLIETIQQGLSQLPKAKILGVGITGSGKEFVKALVGADYADSEIIAELSPVYSSIRQ